MEYGQTAYNRTVCAICLNCDFKVILMINMIAEVVGNFMLSLHLK
jgi:hypothetical protein